MANANVRKNNVKNRQPRKRKNIILIFAAVTAAVAIAVGAVLGIISLIGSVRAVVEYKGVRIDEKTASYLVSVYKTDHIKNLKLSGITYAQDTDEFWAKENPDGSGTFGAGFERAAEAYLKEIAVGAYLYDKNATLSEKTEAAIKKKADSVAEYYYRTEGFDALFAADAAKMGYDYKSYQKAAILLYKSSAAWSAVYGESGGGVSYFPDECNSYLNIAYSHVQLAFVRTKTTFRLDEDGNRVVTGGQYELSDLSDAQERERNEKISSIKRMIEDYYSGASGNVVITAATIEALAKDYKSDQSVERIEKGYYFAPNSEYTASFLEEYKNDLSPITDTVFSLETDSRGNAFGWCDLTLRSIDGTETVTCFIYKSAPEENAYADADLSDFFTDFYADAARYYFYPKEVLARSEEVKVKDKFYEMNVVAIPQNTIHRIKEFLGEG